MLGPKNIRVVTYSEVITNAERAHHEFLKQNRHAGRLVRLLTAINDDD